RTSSELRASRRRGCGNGSPDCGREPSARSRQPWPRAISTLWSGRQIRAAPDAGEGSRALDPAQPARRGPPLDDEQRGPRIEVSVHDLGDVRVEAVTVRSLGDPAGRDHPTGDLRLTRPLRLGALDRVDRGAVQREARIALEICALACVRHRAEYQFAV